HHSPAARSAPPARSAALRHRAWWRVLLHPRAQGSALARGPRLTFVVSKLHTRTQGDGTMGTQAPTKPSKNQTVEERVKQLRQLFAEAPEYARKALENSIKDLAAFGSAPRARVESAGRAGLRQGKISELTLLAPFAPGGAARLRALLELRDGSFDD